jgi:hypothetical protein
MYMYGCDVSVARQAEWEAYTKAAQTAAPSAAARQKDRAEFYLVAM